MTSEGDDGFTILAAAELYGSKVNLELDFPYHPSISEVRTTIVQIFGMERAVKRPEGSPSVPFAVSKLQIYSDDGFWADLQNAAQLHSWCQLYAFQEESEWHSEGCSEIPPPQKPMQAALPDTADVNEKIKIIFEELDVSNAGGIGTDELKRGCKTLGINFTTDSLARIHSMADKDGDGLLNFLEFKEFCCDYSTLADCMYYRTRDFWDEFRRKQEIQNSQGLLAHYQSNHQQSKLEITQRQEDLNRIERKISALEEMEIAKIRNRESSLLVEVQNVQTAMRSSEEEIKDCQQDIHIQRDKVSSIESQHHEIRQQLSHCKDKINIQKSDFTTQQEMHSQLLQSVEESQRELDRMSRHLNASEVEYETVVSKNANIDQTLNQHIDKLQSMSSYLESKEVHREQLTEDVTAIEQLLLDEQSKLSGLVRVRQELDRELKSASETHTTSTAAADDLASKVSSQRELLAQLNQEYLNYTSQRRSVEAEEQPMLDEELKLKEERDSLFMRESKLREDATGYFKSSKRITRRRSTEPWKMYP